MAGDHRRHRAPLPPIVLTALAAVLAMIPLSRSVFFGPMAVAIMGGLIVATALTLLFLPALYAAWFRCGGTSRRATDMTRAGRPDRLDPASDGGASGLHQRGGMKPTDIGIRHLPQGRRLPVGLPGAYAGAGIHPPDRRRPLRRRLHGELAQQRVPRDPRPHLRPSLRTGLPARRVGENNGDKPEPVAICRLKRVAADFRGRRLDARMPAGGEANGTERVACVGAGPSSLTVARDLAPLGYAVTVFEAETQGRRLHAHPGAALPPARTGDRRGNRLHPRPRRRVRRQPPHRIDARLLLARDYDAVFVGSGAPRGRDLDSPCLGRRKPPTTSIGIDWLASFLRPRRQASASASSCSAAATPRWTAAARRGAWAART